jgi:hypothetical protein
LTTHWSESSDSNRIPAKSVIQGDLTWLYTTLQKKLKLPLGC